ncbi:putative kinetochore protein spc24 [Termitomyces sp. J132]|nr:putative kinetochore protein spc24 [Termitomyces sp. J132]
MFPIIDPEEDYLTIVAAEEKIAATESQRKREIEEAQANMKALVKLLEAARISSKRPASVPSEQAHAKVLNELDRTKLDLMKSISDMESHVASQEAELTKLKDEAHRLEEYDPAAEHTKELAGSALRLRMYEKLGFEPVFDKKGVLMKMLVHSAQSGDLHVVPMDGQKSDFEQSRHLWKLASS